MKMIVIKALLLFLLYDSTFAQSQACMAALAELNTASPECQQAYQQVADAANMTNSTNSTDSTNGTMIFTLDLEDYCSSTCRPIVEQIATACDDGSERISTTAIVDLTCLENSDEESCAGFLAGDTIIGRQQANLEGEVFVLKLEDLQVCLFACDEECAMMLQEFVDSLGCCYYPLVEAFGGQTIGIDGLLESCGVELPPQQPTCQVIGRSGGGGGDDDGGATGLKAIGFSIILSVAAIISLL